MSTQTLRSYELPIPEFFDPDLVDKLWSVKYESRAADAKEWAETHDLKPAARDSMRIAFVPIDTQNTFSNPGGELFVGGRGGNGAVEDSLRMAEFIYRNLRIITKIIPTLDSHTAWQIFHPVFWVNSKGEHPAPGTAITLEDILSKVWTVNPEAAGAFLGDASKYLALQAHAEHYIRTLDEGGKYPLMIWPYHGVLGGVGHALVPSVEEAIFFHNIARRSQTEFEFKGGNPLTENYSVLRPEVLTTAGGLVIATKNAKLFETLISNDIIIIGGQAKSHCVAWTIQDLLDEILAKDPELAKKVYIVEDLTTPVYLPKEVTGLAEDVDFTEPANEAFKKFAAAGMNVVKST